MGQVLYDTESFFWLLEQKNQEGRTERTYPLFF